MADLEGRSPNLRAVEQYDTVKEKEKEMVRVRNALQSCKCVCVCCLHAMPEPDTKFDACHIHIIT